METPIKMPTRCKAHRKNGDPCKNRPVNGATVCRMHGGGAPQVRKKAAERIAEAADDAAALLVLFMQDPKNDIKVRTQIAQDLLNRAGFAGKNAVDLKVSIFDQAVANGEFLIDLGEVDEPLTLESSPNQTTPAGVPEPTTPTEPRVQLRKRRRA